MNVLVINHCSTNKGDKAVLEFILQELAANGIRHVTVSANEPTCCPGVGTSGDLEVKFVPWGWNDEQNRKPGFLSRLQHKIRREFYPRSYAMVRRRLLGGSRPKFLSLYCNRDFYKALLSADFVVSTGGHHVTSILAPQAISPQTFEMALALLADKPLYLWSQSIGPFEFQDEENHRFIREILLRATAIYVRDKRSLDELAQLDIQGTKIHKTYESVLGFGEQLGSLDKPSDRLPVVGISVYSAQTRSAEEHELYVASLCQIINHVTASGHRVTFFPMQLQGEVADDRPCIEAILETVRDRAQCSVYEEAASMREHIKEVAKCRFFIGHKTHSVIIALVTGTPLLAIAYHPKTADFMTQFELSENCMDDCHLDGSRLVEMFDRITSEMDVIGTKQLEKSAQFGEVVRRDFCEMIRQEQISIVSK